MKKSGLLIRAALPVFALVGAVTFGTDACAYGMGENKGKRVFKWIDVRTDLSAGYRTDTLKFENQRRSDITDSLTRTNLGQERIEERITSEDDIFQLRSSTTIAAHDGALVNSFLEASGAIGWVLNEEKKWRGHDRAGNGSYRFNFRKDNDQNGKDVRAYDAQAVVGYDLAKLKNPWKDVSFKVFGGYYWSSKNTSRKYMRGRYNAQTVNAVGNNAFDLLGRPVSRDYLNGVPARGNAITNMKWRGPVVGFCFETMFNAHTLWVRPEYRLPMKMKGWTKTRIHGVTPVEKLVFKRHKKAESWNFTGGYQYRIDPDWTVHLDGGWKTMVHKKPNRSNASFKVRNNKVKFYSANVMAGVGFNY